MRIPLLSVLLISLFVVRAHETKAAGIQTITLEQYQQRVNRNNDTLYVVNFWATWCRPCVEELPHFKELSEEMKQLPVKFVMMSLDASNTAFKVTSFLERQRIGIECHILSAGDPNIWLNKVEKKWEGSIPATLLYRHGKKLDFYEGQFENKEQLKQFINRNK